MEKYSVLMSVYFKEKPEYLCVSLDSMLAQTIRPDEIVLVEDGKLTNELYSIIDYYCDRFGDIIRILELPQNGGLGKALNAGLDVCQNELVARMDSDDISLPTRCEEQLKAFAEDPNLCIVGTQINEFVGEKDNIVSSRVVPQTNSDILRFARRRSPFNHPTVMYRKSVVKQYSGYSGFGRKEDLDLFLRMVFGGCKVKNLSEALLLYRTNEDNLDRRRGWNNCKEYIQIMYKFFRAGKISMIDMLYVTVGQMVMFFAPRNLVKKLSKKYLRSER